MRFTTRTLSNTSFSIALLTRSRARISDPRPRKLADQIFETQLREIDQMKVLFADLEKR